MIKAYIKLKDLNDITEFHETAMKCNYDLLLECGSMRINPKSLMGLFGVKIKKTMTLIAKYDDRESFASQFSPFFNTNTDAKA